MSVASLDKGGATNGAQLQSSQKTKTKCILNSNANPVDCVTHLTAEDKCGWFTLSPLEVATVNTLELCYTKLITECFYAQSHMTHFKHEAIHSRGIRNHQQMTTTCVPPPSVTALLCNHGDLTADESSGFMST